MKKNKSFRANALLISIAILSLPPKAISASDLMDIAKKRNLRPEDMIAAAKTYTPSGKLDEFLCLNSGGQAGSAILYGVPSMRIYKYVANAAHDPATGYMHETESKEMVRKGRMVDSQPLTWADTHHPSFSETEGRYDGRYAFLNDKANPRIFVMDLRDFETKQVVHNPIFTSAHGGAFVTPNTEYIVEGSQYAAPHDRKYYPLTQESFNKNYRGGITFHKFNNEIGKIDQKNSFTVLAPPYTQDLSDAGKGESYGYSFTNSFCSERYIGTGPDGKNPPFEAGCSARDTDFMHIVHWKKAEELIKKGKFVLINNHKVIPMEVAAKEGVLFLVPEPKSPHGNDISPDGRFIVVAGKLDTHATVFDIRKIKELIQNKDFSSYDEYGLPILDMQKAMHGQVQLGLGPLHSQYGKEPGVVYTSLYLDSQVVKWDYVNKKVLDKVSINYNIGHLVSMQGDSIDPRGRYVVALNKLAIDRFESVGPLLPQNHQLVDTTGAQMKVIYDLPLPLGEPHYTVCIDATKVNPWKTYPVGTNPVTMTKSSFATLKGNERIQKSAGKVSVFATISEEGLAPFEIKAQQGDEVVMYITNNSQLEGATFNVSVKGMGAFGVFAPGETSTLRFVASQPGSFIVEAQDISSYSDPGEQFVATLQVSANPMFDKKRLVALSMRTNYMNELFKLRPSGGNVASGEKRHPGQVHFEEYGCQACHIMGSEETAPNLVGVTKRRSKDWLRKWISNPEKFYKDPTVAPLIAKYGVEMPNLEVKPKDLEDLIEYLESLDK